MVVLAASYLAGIGTAIQWSGELGPYAVSFNLTASETLYIVPAEPRIYEDFVQHKLILEDKYANERGAFVINTYFEPIHESLEEDAADILKIYKFLYQNASQLWRAIGGYPGVLTLGNDEHGELHWVAECRLSDSAELVVRGERLWGMADVVEQLDSIHVEKT